MIVILPNDQQFLLLTCLLLISYIIIAVFIFIVIVDFAEDGVDDEGNMIVLIK